MVWYQYVLGAVLLVVSVIITVIVLLQESRTSGLSGAIAGGADTFFGKTKGRTIEAKLERYTKWLAIIFFVLVLAAFLILYFVK